MERQQISSETMPPNPSPEDSHWREYAIHDAVNTALEAERHRLAQQLETTLISQVNLVLAQINVYEQTTSGQSRTALSVLSSLVRQLLQQAHDLEASLNPTTLETLGLEPALESLTNQQHRSSGVNITLSLPHLRQRLPTHLELALFRTTQEAIARAITHGSATRLDIHLERNTEGLRYTIADNGSRSTADSLESARQRITWLGGHMTCVANNHDGLTITIEFPTETPIELTERELKVIRLLTEGLTNAEIGAQLAIRPRTVKFHLDNIYSKLGVNTRTAAAIYALRHGWVQRHPPA